MATRGDASMEDLLARLAERTREARQKRGWSQEEAAHNCGLATRVYVRIENIERGDVLLSTVQHISAGFGIPTARLLAPRRKRSSRPARRTRTR